jgi:SPP1 gp7 family putative phage head morphogenesis protein
VSGYYVNEAVRKMYGIPLSQLTPEQREILRQDGIRRAKLIDERQKDFMRNNKRAFEDAEKLNKVLASIYGSCQKEILGNVAETIAKVKKAGGEWSYANQSALTRSRGLFEQINKELIKLGKQENTVFRTNLQNIYTDQFLRTVYTLGQTQTVKSSFNMLNPRLIQDTLDYPWSGAMFSDRLWLDKDMLGRNLRVGLTQSMILGEDMDRIADRVGANINTSKYNAMRVARTETKRVTYSSQAAAFEDQNVGEVRYMAANNGGDSRTCDLCKEDHGKVYKLGEEPSLPRHPNCRCWYIPVVKDTFEDNELNELTGSVRGAENYEKWKEKEAARIKAAQEAKQSEEIIKAKVTADTAKADLEKTEVKLTDYPEAFYSKKTEAKNTQALLDYVNAQNVTDPNILKLYKNMDKLCEKLPDDVVIKVTHGEHRVKRSLTKNFEWCVDVGIPKIDPKFVGTCDTSLHEEMHFLDMLLSVRGEVKYPNKMFSESYKPLIGAFDKATPKIGDRAKKLFTEFSEYYQKINKKRHEKYDTMIAELDKQYYAGKIDAKKFNSTAKKIWKEIVAESDKEIRSFKGGGISGLQDIYDAISNGVFRDTGEVIYGHGSSYYQDKRRTNPNCSESIANYAALSIGHPELIEILAEDHPEIVKALRKCVEDMAKEVAKL